MSLDIDSSHRHHSTKILPRSRHLDQIQERKHQHPQLSLTVDTQHDLNKVREIAKNSNEILNYNEIVEICSKMPSEVMNIKPISNVKFPGGVLVTYSTFRHEMDLRIAKTKIVNITLEEFENVLRSQRISKAKKFGEEQL